jgi:hypothetical protein
MLMSNKLPARVKVLHKALRVLHNNPVFVKNVNKQYSTEFAISGAKVGSTINVRLPNRSASQIDQDGLAE